MAPGGNTAARSIQLRLVDLVVPRRSGVSRLLLGLACAAIALTSRLAFSLILEGRLPWVTAFPAVLVAGLFGDVLAVSVAVMLCGAAGFLLIDHETSSLVAFLVNGGLVGAAGVALRRTLCAGREQVAELRHLHGFGTEAMAMHERAPLLQHLLEVTIALQGSDRGFIALYDRSSNRLVPGAAIGHDAEFLRRFSSLPVEEGQAACGTSAARRARVIVEDTETDALFANLRDFARDAKFRAAWSTPLLTTSGELLGVLATHFPTQHRPTDRQVQLVELYARLAADAIEMRLLNERAEQDRFRILVNSIRDYAIFLIDLDGRVVTWNAGAEAIKGYLADEIIGKPIDVFYTAEDRAAGLPKTLLDRARTEGRVEYEGWRVRKDGSRLWANVVITALRNVAGELTGFAKVTRDLTERRALEQERLRASQAEEGLRMRDEFLSIASHELKTPLAALRLQLDILGERLDAHDHQMSKRFARAARSSERLTELVQTLLDVSRIANGQLELSRERFALGDLVVDVVDRLREAATNADCHLRVHCDTQIVGDWDRLRIEQVVTNLLSNSIKYAPGALIDVTVAAEGASAVMTVADNGPGIPEADLSRVFRRFERAASTRHYAGLGLGLYVTRQIVEAHGGTVQASNQSGSGAVFTVRLPREGAAVSETSTSTHGGLH